MLPESTPLRLQGALQGHCPKQALQFVHFPGLSCSGSQVLRRAQTRLGMHFVPFPGPSSSGHQAFGRCTVPAGPSILITSLVPAARFPRGPVSAMCLLWGATLLADVNHPGSQENVISNWEPAHSLVEDASLWSQDWSSPLPSSSGCHPPASLPPVGGCAGLQPACSPLVFTQSFVL